MVLNLFYSFQTLVCLSKQDIHSKIIIIIYYVIVIKVHDQLNKSVPFLWSFL